MANSSQQDVELIPQSAGVRSPSDAPAATNNHKSIEGDASEGADGNKNGLVTDKDLLRMDDQLLDDGSARSDTDTSRAGSIAGDGKSTDAKPVKKFAASKPVSFAKYSVPKTIANAPVKAAVEKAPVAAPTLISSQLQGRPRLVAKSASSLQHKTIPFKPSAPDPMQVWNKNRATPQPSTKHLTDEELKKQYDIHLTPRIQSDGDGKEAKWADIDDDEDDWAPETIEWNDGTKTTVNATDTPATKQNNAASNDPAPDTSRSENASSKSATPQYSSSVGPNATVLKVGANLERQQAQKAAAQQLKGPAERAPLLGSKAAPAPPPSKSPWQKIPTVDKISPMSINPQPIPAPQASRYPPLGAQPAEQPLTAPSPAKEISADDFNRSWRNSPSSQTRELFNSSSGRYETVMDGRRRMSKNEQNFRAPAVLQRPGQTDTRAPAEPSPAFQTHRTSIDQGRRRASSSISGGSGPFARRMSFKSNDAPGPAIDSHRDQHVDTMGARPISRDGPSPSLTTPSTYQARGGDYMTSGPGPMTDSDIEAQRAAQKAAMKENIERARKRKQEEEQRIQAEKEERIRAKLASLGPPPEKPKPEEDKAATTPTQPAPANLVQSPPKPPQPLATGEPQQYGMMKVHPLDSVRKISPVMHQHADQIKMPTSVTDVSAPNMQSDPKQPAQPPVLNGNYVSQEEVVTFSDDDANPEPSPRFGRAVVPTISDARTGWGAARNDHRPPPAGNLWGLSSNKALGNGTFDHSLAGYSPQDLSRTSSTGQPWMNGRTPNVGQSPQLHHANQTVPETRSHILQSMTSPGQQPLSMNSEADSILPASRPAPIGPPQTHTTQQNNGPSGMHVFPNPPQANGITAWNNFPSVARVDERAESERFQRERNERREEEKRSGVRQQAPYDFNETFKQVQVGEQVGQRHVSNVAQATHAPSYMFGAVGSLAPNEAPKPASNQAGRGSRFFPPSTTGLPQDRRAVTYGHYSVPRSPSPPPAEEYASYHPAFDGNLARPVVHFPPVRPVVRLPPPPSPAPAAPPIASKELSPVQPKAPMTWAARVSMPAPVAAPPPVNRVVSMPLVQNPSWQERFNGLLGRKDTGTRAGAQSERAAPPTPAVAVTKEPFDVAVAVSAFVSLPTSSFSLAESGQSSTKDVEGEEDLFEDREAGSLPIVHFPRDVPPILLARIGIPRSTHSAIDPITAHMFMVNNWSERHGQQKPQYAIIRAPGANGKGIRKDLPSKAPEMSSQSKVRHSPGHFGSQKFPRGKMGAKPRPMAKAH